MATAFVFPGQGSQSVGMLSELFDKHEIFKDYYQRASNTLGFDLAEIILQDSKNQLNQTAYTQPAILAASCALWHVWRNLAEKTPDYLAGHSLGEYTAMVASEVLSFEDAISLVHLRGKLMQQAVAQGEGMMAAVVGISDELVAESCVKMQQISGDDISVAIANYNSPGQVVVAGKAKYFAEFTDIAKAAGAKKVIPLPVSVPSHCMMMLSASEKLAQEMEKVNFNSANIAIIQNVDGLPHTDKTQIIKNLVSQLYQPVKWTHTVNYMAQNGVTNCYECGPGKVLQGLIKRIDKNIACELVSQIEQIN